MLLKNIYVYFYFISIQASIRNAIYVAWDTMKRLYDNLSLAFTERKLEEKNLNPAFGSGKKLREIEFSNN